MKNNKVTSLTRGLLLICSLGLLVVLFTPIWRIDLQAPQYPEGLRMFIYANRLAGDIDVINGLNHYIGMKTLHADDFSEFRILPGIIIGFAVLFIVAAIIGRRGSLNFLCILFVVFGILAMVDFWRWEYDYGHDLNPNAAIIVPGMSYQPPLIGFKQLLNFGAFSIPATGGWIFLGVGAVLLYSVVSEWIRLKRTGLKKRPIPILILGMLVMSHGSCNTDPQPIRIGKDNCDFCKMTISDNRFGAEIVTKKSKVYKFDDAHCVIAFLNSKQLTKDQIGGVYFTNFSSPHQLISTEHAHFLQSYSFKSPMNGNIAAFINEESRAGVSRHFKGGIISWEDMQK